jgi:carboxyl-terminal processing protease
MSIPLDTPGSGSRLRAGLAGLHRLRRACVGSRPWRWWLTASLLALAGCGGGGDGGGGSTVSGASCQVEEEKVWLRNFFTDTYFWNGVAPRPDSAGYDSATRYFSALLYAGGDPVPGSTNGATWPRDRWSSYQSTERYNQFYGEAQTMGFGVAVAGLEVKGQPAQPLYVRYVDPNSPAALNDVRRADRVLAINGRPASELISADDFSALSATAAGQILSLRLARGGAEREVSLTASVYGVVPLPAGRVVTTPAGRRVGYLHLQNFISQAQPPLESSLADFRAQGVQEVVLDLRYNGGGLVSFANTLGNYLGGTRAAGQIFTSLLYTPSQAFKNATYRFANPAPADAVNAPRVIVLMGRRTCSASELVINGLRGAGLQVVGVGETSCGKPVGSVAGSNCGTTWSIVNFEGVNARGEGRYFDGIAATCPVAEDFSQPMASATDPLLKTALAYSDSGSCPQPTARAIPLYRRSTSDSAEPGERREMMP